MNRKQIIEEKVFSFMREHHMLNPQDKVVVGVSGGADSVCLLFVLLEYQKQFPISLAVVHVNHGIRKEAESDCNYVEQLCKIYELPFYPFYVDVKAKAKQEKCTEEEAGRNARYEAFSRVTKEFDANKIAVAHNCNDRSETMLFHLFRGSGVKGLGSIRPVRDNIIRPILCLERREIEEYLEIQGIHYCKDATNEKDDYTRNRIRHHILPYAEQEIVSGCVAHMAKTADMMAETEDYLEQQTIKAMAGCVWKNEIDVEVFLLQHNVIRQRILYEVITSLTNSRKDISYVHIKDLLRLFTEQGNRSISLPFGIIGRRQYGKVILERQSDVDKYTKYQDTCGKVIHLENNKNLFQKVSMSETEELEFQVFDYEGNLPDFPSNQYTKWFDYDKIIECLELRTRKTGDYLTIAGQKGAISHKSLKDYMIAEKIPKSEREHIPLIADGQHVVWLIGYRISEYYKISRNTKRVLQVQLIRKELQQR